MVKLNIKNMTVENADALQKELLWEVEAAPQLQLDLSEVQECDLCGLQLLTAAAKQAFRQGKRFSLRNLPEAVEQNLLLTGLDTQMEVDDG